jgi:hypothetical protein
MKGQIQMFKKKSVSRQPSSRSTKKDRGKRLSFKEWEPVFKRYLVKNQQQGMIRKLVVAGAQEKALLEFLYRECHERVVENVSEKQEMRDLCAELDKLAVDARNLAKRIQDVNFLVIGTDYFDKYIRLPPGMGEDAKDAGVIPAEMFACLPKLLDDYSRAVRQRATVRSKIQRINVRQGPEVCVLAAYISALTGESPYQLLSELLAAGSYCTDPTREVKGAGSVQKSIRRFQEKHPNTHKEVQDLVTTYLSAKKSGKEQQDFATFIYEGLYQNPDVDDIVMMP